MNVLISTFGPFSPLPLRKELNPKIWSTLQSVIVNASTAYFTRAARTVSIKNHLVLCDTNIGGEVRVAIAQASKNDSLRFLFFDESIYLQAHECTCKTQILSPDVEL
mmetsp:Transcript_20904/g.37250  ORF Transcript_20904/g.37250 Transcript_20904/m.37250 type:complete len:107 (-) Transcript_20904:88-408(-)